VKVVKVEKTERVTMNLVILLNQACLEPLAAQQNRLNYGFDKVQLRIYETDKPVADNLSAFASYERIRTHTGYVSTDSELTESLKHLIPQEEQPKPPTSVGVANQLLQPEGSAKAGRVVSTRAKEFKRTSPY